MSARGQRSVVVKATSVAVRRWHRWRSDGHWFVTKLEAGDRFVFEVFKNFAAGDKGPAAGLAEQTRPPGGRGTPSLRASAAVISNCASFS